jgi:hypothetical protein
MGIAATKPRIAQFTDFMSYFSDAGRYVEWQRLGGKQSARFQLIKARSSRST